MSQHPIAMRGARWNARKRPPLEDRALRSHGELQAPVEDQKGFMSLVTAVCRKSGALVAGQDRGLEQAVGVFGASNQRGVVVTTRLPQAVSRSNEVRRGRSG